MHISQLFSLCIFCDQKYKQLVNERTNAFSRRHHELAFTFNHFDFECTIHNLSRYFIFLFPYPFFSPSKFQTFVTTYFISTTHFPSIGPRDVTVTPETAFSVCSLCPKYLASDQNKHTLCNSPSKKYQQFLVSKVLLLS